MLLSPLRNINPTNRRKTSIAGNPPVNTVAPTTTGSAVVGNVLSGTDGTWTGDPTITYAYQWQESTDAVNFSNKSGETNANYTVVYTDAGKYIRRRVTASNGAGSTNANSSNYLTVTSYVYNFDGVDNYISFGDILDSSLAGASANFTVMAIVKRGATGAFDQNIFSKWSGLSNQRQLRLDFSSDKLRVTTSGTGADVANMLTTGTFTNTSSYYQIFLTVNIASRTIRMYVNGSVVYETTSSFHTTIFNSTAPILIGAQSDNTGAKINHFTGYVSDFYIWNKALSVVEMDGIYNGGDFVDPATVSGGILDTPFDKDTFSTNWTVVDEVAANNGTSSGMVVGDRVAI